MALLSGLKQGLKIAGKIDRKYNLNKIFIQKYVPPGYRSRANKIVDIAGSLGGGYGIVRFIESLYAEDTPGNRATIPFKKQYPSGKPYQTRSRFPIRSSYRNNNFLESCRRQRRTSTSKYHRSNYRFNN